MGTRAVRSLHCIVIAGPNGARKTTVAREFIPREAGGIHFANVNLIAGGLSPLLQELAARQADRFVSAELIRLAIARKDFAFESTLSRQTYLRLLKRWKASRYRIELVFLSLPSVEWVLQCMAVRVRPGVHGVPRAYVVRRFNRSWRNFQPIYRELAETWPIYDNAGEAPRLLEEGP